ncbi:hypothetical protein R1flu_020506 [Riccia fluitans]|uniref:Mitochondrial carrier protein n=1 Tax=Riccia fluitans TaxID=41844 RepID=A0ABD1ZLQ5_9MARC
MQLSAPSHWHKEVKTGYRRTTFVKCSTWITTNSVREVAVETAAFYPIDTLKTLLQVNANAGRKLDASAVVEGVSKSSGFTGLYGGVGWQLLGRLPALGVRFGVYELMTAFYADGRGDNYVTLSESFLAGLTAGAVESLVSTPFDFLKVRAQITSATTGEVKVQRETFNFKSLKAQVNSHSNFSDGAHWDRIRRSLSLLPSRKTDIVVELKRYPWLVTGSGQPPLVNDVGGLRGAVSLEGWNALWRGLRPGLYRDAMYGGFFFCGWQFLDDLVTEARAYLMNPPPMSWDEVSPSSPWQLSITAGIAASFAATASHSFDSAKTRTQATVLPKYLTMERKLLNWKAPGSWFESIVGFNPYDRHVLRTGLGLRVLQQGVGTFALVLTYHTAVQVAKLKKW